MVERVASSVLTARSAGASTDDDFVDAHVRATTALLVVRSGVVADKLAAGQVAVVGLSYRLAEGRVYVVFAQGRALPADQVAGLA
ncbi:hypothetical protein [Streptomyces sp. NPDC052292]|uniref:hypothetical protein n=1 Tax=Streptomyces sp. NPDC052292 TaxID=3155053 RepID=UPI0034245F85